MDFADELAADLELDGPSQFEREPSAEPAMDVDGADDDLEDAAAADMALPQGGVRPADELDADEVEATDTAGIADVGTVARLAGSRAFKQCLADIGRYRDQPPSDMSSPEAPEYKLIVQANNYAVEVDNEILLVHKVRELVPRSHAARSLDLSAS